MDFIDGLRALAALYIVVHHGLQTASYMTWWLYPFRYGFEVVVVFITISGFCLSLPQSRRGQWTVDARNFYWKRARRILPPYYAALALGFLISLLFAFRSHAQDYLGNRISWLMIWSHVALVQNWIPKQAMTVDGPLWSIAVECQIYLFFPILVLLRHRLGRWVTLALWFILVQALARATHDGGYVGMLFIFAIGMLGADLAFRPASRPWLLPGIVLSTVVIFFTYDWHRTLAESLIGMATALLMAYLVQVRTSVGNRILGWKPLAWVGTFSYSVYLIHSYVEIGATRWCARYLYSWREASPAQHAVAYACMIPVILLLSYIFHRFFERPFMGAARQRAEDRLRLETTSNQLLGAD